jgi:hypothetical protein
MKPTWRAHGSKRLKLQFDVLLSDFAFTFNLRRYTMVGGDYESDGDGEGALEVGPAGIGYFSAQMPYA